jgi:hypothetical protein
MFFWRESCNVMRVLITSSAVRFKLGESPRERKWLKFPIAARFAPNVLFIKLPGIMIRVNASGWHSNTPLRTTSISQKRCFATTATANPLQWHPCVKRATFVTAPLVACSFPALNVSNTPARQSSAWFRLTPTIGLNWSTDVSTSSTTDPEPVNYF